MESSFADEFSNQIGRARIQMLKDINRQFFGGTTMATLGDYTPGLSIIKAKNGFVVSFNCETYVFTTLKKLQQFIADTYTKTKAA